MASIPLPRGLGYGSSGAADQSDQTAPSGYCTVFTISTWYFSQMKHFNSLVHALLAKWARNRRFIKIGIAWCRREHIHPPGMGCAILARGDSRGLRRPAESELPYNPSAHSFPFHSLDHDYFHSPTGNRDANRGLLPWFWHNSTCNYMCDLSVHKCEKLLRDSTTKSN